MVSLITSVHRLEFFPSGYYSKLKKSTCQPNRGNLLTHSLTYSLTHCITIDKLPSESLLSFCLRQKHMKELSTNSRRQECKCQKE